MLAPVFCALCVCQLLTQAKAYRRRTIAACHQFPLTSVVRESARTACYHRMYAIVKLSFHRDMSQGPDSGVELT
uniref:Putative secreted protein n=1 Tax=Anopheles marajoara TaxID=58244 RepID=A0A2M4CDA1_9DIPT